ncbi:MAG: aspartate ammonia-lyase [bacterium]|nr:aspartate ammonia-lyase [bacterium]
MKKRTEKDSMGQVQLDANAYYGAFTQRAKNNFQISGQRAPTVFKEALGLVKLAAAQSNGSLKLLNSKQKTAIERACQEFIAGKFDNEFTLDIFQAGAGTSYNMNSNEIIANRANEILKGKKGEYKFVHPNNHVNMGQSTNDVIPTVTRIASLLLLPDLLREIKELEEELGRKAKEGKKITKVGRTHLQDAVPITFGQSFDAYKEALRKSREFIENQSQNLQILGIGGTATGTGINAHPRYKSLMIKNLSKLTGIKFKSAKNLTETSNNMNALMNFSASLRSLAVNLLNFCGDLKLLSMGPKAGISEIILPAVQPGSSIMPGKINPSIPECTEMICLQVLGNDRVIELAAQKSQFELNVFCPIIMPNLLQSILILTNGLKTLRERCIKDLKIDKERTQYLFENSLATATALVPEIGYSLTAEIVKSALKNNHTIKEEVLKRKLFTEKQLSKTV